MEGQIRIDAAGGMDRKYFYAFVKGLTNIKYKDTFLKSKRDFDLDESMDLQFLYANLFNEQETSLDCKHLLDTMIRARIQQACGELPADYRSHRAEQHDQRAT